MMELRQILLSFKNYTQELLRTLEEENTEEFEIFLLKRQEIINDLEIMNYNKETFNLLGEELGLIELEERLQKNYADKKNDIYYRLQENNRNINANSNYMQNSRRNINFLDKKI